MAQIFKICPAADWQAAEAAGVFKGSAADLKDGFIHFSTRPQLRETAARHFAGETGLLLIAFDEACFGAALRWEPSRGGDLFPHVFGAIDPALADWAKPLPALEDL